MCLKRLEVYGFMGLLKTFRGLWVYKFILVISNPIDLPSGSSLRGWVERAEALRGRGRGSRSNHLVSRPIIFTASSGSAEDRDLKD
jgi:hypothetical protein